MCLAGHDEHGGLRVVAFEALTEVRLVQLDGHACLGTQYGRVSADALDDPLAHEERGLQAYSATLGAFAQAQTVHEAFEEPHPHARLELAHAHHPVRANAERPVAVHALPTLGAVTSTPFADDADAAAAHARLHLFRVARRRVQRESLVQGVAQRLDGKVALLRRQFAQFLPDPIGYTRHLARSHTTIVATQQLQCKSKSQPWSNRAKIKEDPRITKIGHFIRKTSIDELPQFFDAFIGTMSVVGPRPQRQFEVGEYNQVFATRLLVKPGITGPWQVSGRNDLSDEESEALDVAYVQNWSVMGDLIYILRTVGTVLHPNGAY